MLKSRGGVILYIAQAFTFQNDDKQEGMASKEGSEEGYQLIGEAEKGTEAGIEHRKISSRLAT